MLLAVDRRGGAVKRPRFLVEGEPLAAEHLDARRQRFELPVEKLPAQLHQLFRPGRHGGQPRQEVASLGVDLVEGRRAGCRVRAPLGRAVVGVHVAVVVDAHRQHQLDVRLGGGVERQRLAPLAIPGRSASGERENGECER